MIPIAQTDECKRVQDYAANSLINLKKAVDTALAETNVPARADLLLDVVQVADQAREAHYALATIQGIARQVNEPRECPHCGKDSDVCYQKMLEHMAED